MMAARHEPKRITIELTRGQQAQFTVSTGLLVSRLEVNLEDLEVSIPLPGQGSDTEQVRVGTLT